MYEVVIGSGWAPGQPCAGLSPQAGVAGRLVPLKLHRCCCEDVQA